MSMKKIYVLEDLDCANCAAKIEKEVGELEGVASSKVTLLTQKLVIDVKEEDSESIEKAIKKIVKKYEPDVTVIRK